MFKLKHKIIAITVALGLAAWLSDTIFDYLIFYRSMGFFDLLILHMPSHELYIRTTIFGLFIIFGLVIYRYISKAEESAGRFQRLFDNVTDGVFVTSLDDQGAVKFIEVNTAACKTLGYSREEMLRLSQADLLEPADLNNLAVLAQEIRDQGHILFETALKVRDGHKILVEVNAHLFDLAGQPAILSIVRDITGRKQAEAKLLESERRLKSLAAQLLSIQETERRRISNELHDELGQAMMLLKFQLSAIRKRLTDEALEQEFNQILTYFDRVIEDIRRLAKDLSPTVLENLGVSAAVRSMLEEFQKNLPIEVTADIEDVDRLLSPQVQLNIYRIFQEALTNIGRHAQAQQVAALMKKQDGLIYIEIRDNGKGFNVSDIFSNQPKTKRFGLATINERVQLIGGSLDLQSQAGAGTKISFSVPLNGDRDDPLSHLVGG